MTGKLKTGAKSMNIFFRMVYRRKHRCQILFW